MPSPDLNPAPHTVIISHIALRVRRNRQQILRVRFVFTVAESTTHSVLQGDIATVVEQAIRLRTVLFRSFTSDLAGAQLFLIDFPG